jgi:hypothetical protein
MSFFSRILPSGGGSSPKDERQVRQEAVEKMCSALLHASLLEDRRSAAKALKSVAKHYQLEIGSLGMPSLIAALKRDAEDVELSRNILETFIAICSSGATSEDGDLHIEFCEILLKDRKVVEVILNCLEERNQYVRFSVLQLFSILEELLPAQLPLAILASPSGLGRLLDLLDDEREIVRNEVILLLQRLTENSPEIQRIAVFEGTFERLFELVIGNGIFDDGVLVEDALIIIHNLLRHNPSNQNYYFESPCFAKIATLLTLEDDDYSRLEWNSQMVKNLCATMEIPCILLHQDNPKLDIVQNALYKTGLFPLLVQFALAPGPHVVRTKALVALDMLMSRNELVQGAFARHVINIDDLHPTPAVLSVIIAAVDGTSSSNGDPFLRLAATNMLGSYLRFNPDGQLVIAATFKSPRLAGSPELIEEQSAGSMIVERALDMSGVHRDPFRVWFPTVILSHILRENDQCKTIALEHRYTADGQDEEEMPLFVKIMLQLTEAVKDPRHTHTATAYLMLFATWMYGFPSAVSALLSEGSNIQFVH